MKIETGRKDKFRDAERRRKHLERVAGSQRDRKKVHRRFDSTCGYPGEGPTGPATRINPKNARGGKPMFRGGGAGRGGGPSKRGSRGGTGKGKGGKGFGAGVAGAALECKACGGPHRDYSCLPNFKGQSATAVVALLTQSGPPVAPVQTVAQINAAQDAANAAHQQKLLDDAAAIVAFGDEAEVMWQEVALHEMGWEVGPPLDLSPAESRAMLRQYCISLRKACEHNDWIARENQHAGEVKAEKDRLSLIEREAKRRAILRDCKSKAKAAHSTKDFDSPTDRGVVKRSIALILRLSKFHEVMRKTDDEGEIIESICLKVGRHAARVARRSERNRVKTVRSWRRVFSDTLLDVQTYKWSWESDAKTSGTRLKTLVGLPTGVVLDGVKNHLAHAAGLICRALGSALRVVGEELLKRVAGALAVPILKAVALGLGIKLIPSVLMVIGAKVLVSVMFSVYESVRRGESTRAALSRCMAHIMFTLMPFAPSVIMHAAWNAYAVFIKKPEYALDISYTPASLPVRSDVCVKELGLEPVETQDNFKAVWCEHECVEKFGCRGAFGVVGVEPRIYRACSCNERVSLCGRVGKLMKSNATPQATKEITEYWNVAARGAEQHFSTLVRPVTRPQNREEWLASQTPMARNIYRRMVDEGIEYPNCADAFIKQEVAMCDEEIEVSDPRMIQAANKRIVYEAGPWLRRYAKNFRNQNMPRNFDNIDLDMGRHIVYTCGLNNIQIGDCFSQAVEGIEGMLLPGERLVVVEDDQSRFDLHLGEGSFKSVFRTYRGKLPRKVLRRLLRTAKSKGRTKLGTRYSVPWTMQSGFPDTSITDTVANATMKVTIHGLHRRWFSIICGDDSVTVTTDTELNRLGGIPGLVSSYDKFGMDVKVVVQSDPGLAAFCSGRFFRTGNTFVLVPKIGKIISKLGWDTKDRNTLGTKAWLRGICATLDVFAGCDPLCAALAEGLRGSLGHGRVIENERSVYKYTSLKVEGVSAIDVACYYDLHYGFNAADISHHRIS